jgi:multidrug efflux pump subunit AcrA (membrane-fusion protein)
LERVEYDPEIDPSIREAREAAERERELSARIRIEIERYVADNDLVPRSEAIKSVAHTSGIEPPPWDEAPSEEEANTDDAAPDPDTPKTRRQLLREAREAERRAKEAAKNAEQQARQAARELRREQRDAGAAAGKKAMKSVFTGSILGSEWVRKMWPWLLGIAFVLVAYIAYSFQVQTLHLERQQLERDVRELSIKAVERTAERVRLTRRSAIVERLREKNIPLEEFPHPVKKIER